MSSELMRGVASAAAAGSSKRRTWYNSSIVAGSTTSITEPMLSKSRSGSKVVTYVPSPWRVRKIRAKVSARTASRSTERDTPSSAVSSSSVGSRWPGVYRPEVIMALSCETTSSDRVVTKPTRSSARREHYASDTVDEPVGGPEMGREPLHP